MVKFEIEKLEYIPFDSKGIILQNLECPIPTTKYRLTPVMCGIILPDEEAVMVTCPFWENTNEEDTCECHYEDFAPVTINIPT